MKRKRVFITGARGFFGQNFVRQFAGRYTIFAPTRKELDIRDYRTVERYVKHHGISHVVHCATSTDEDLFESTILMFRSILHIAPCVERIVYFGSGAEYDKFRDLHRVSETEWGRRVPRDTNGLSKYINGLLAVGAPNLIRFIIFGVYGPYEDYRYKYISNSIVKHIYGLPIRIKQNAVFDYVYIDDVVTVTEYCFSHTAKHRTYNFTPDASISLSDIAVHINTVGRKSVPIEIVHAGMNYEYTGSNKRLRGWLPDFYFTPYEEGIRRLYEFYLEHRDELDIDTVKKDPYFQRAAIRE